MLSKITSEYKITHYKTNRSKSQELKTTTIKDIPLPQHKKKLELLHFNDCYNIEGTQ